MLATSKNMGWESNRPTAVCHGIIDRACVDIQIGFGLEQRSEVGRMPDGRLGFSPEPGRNPQIHPRTKANVDN